MASIAPLHTLFPKRTSVNQSTVSAPSWNSSLFGSPVLVASKASPWLSKKNKRRPMTVVAAVGEVSSDSITYLYIGAAIVALLGTAFPAFFSRKDLCPECDGAGFVRKSGAPLRANAARKDQVQIVCARCNGLGKLNQVDK
ncbi:hypothetical protein RJ641_028362 [Dillenia turbinata]|uniref:Heat shock protein DnaJ n=1 Tax=Dillenia turbinata TaxID=194707 RepID=A0AAN8W067_9MAGN